MNIPPRLSQQGPAGRHGAAAMTLMGLFLLSLAGLAKASSSTDFSGYCMLACSEASCVVATASSSSKLLSSGPWTRFSDCKSIEVKQGKVELGYLHKGRWLRASFPSDAPGKVQAQFEAKPPDKPCAIITSECVQKQAMAKTAAVGGHGIDSRAALPGGEGEPCALGLPCGAVLPAEQPREVRLGNAGLQARQLQLRIARGQARPPFLAQQSLSVSEGRLQVPANALQAGAMYEYSLLDGAGQVLARGEFSTISGKSAALLQQLAKQRSAQGLDPALAWYDALVDNELWWDALLLEQGSAAP
nr:hypothetical protein [uncultured Roseateles sp.]